MTKTMKKALARKLTADEVEAARTKLTQLQRTLGLAVGALDGPDPEATYGYLALLDEHLRAALVGR